jgi:hypothetical protein
MMAPRVSKTSTPEDFPTQPLQPSGDYSYTLEIVMQMQLTMGKLLEAVDSLKNDSKEYRAELKKIGQDIHGAKVGFRWVVGVCLTAGAVIGWAVNTYISATHK